MAICHGQQHRRAVLVAWGIFYLTRVLPISRQELIDARRRWWTVRND
ncbi:hypothetical protein [Micromonospora sp. NPDC005367]